MTTLVFGHSAPDTDSTGSPLIWNWFLNHTGLPARAVLLGKPNTEAAFVLKRWGFEQPEIIDDITDGQSCIIVDTNNPAELPDNINNADIIAIIDHHRLVGGLETREPLNITIRPLACTATIMHQMMGDHAGHMPEGIKGLMLSCILSDTLAFRSPTTTDIDKTLAESLAADLGLDIQTYADEMFAAKSDVSAFSDADLLRMDSKEFAAEGTKLRISVLETTSPAVVLDRKDSLISSMDAVATDDGVAAVMLFVIDILREEATLLIPNDMVKTIAERSFDVTVNGDQVGLPGVMSRKKQIIPALKLS